MYQGHYTDVYALGGRRVYKNRGPFARGFVKLAKTSSNARSAYSCLFFTSDA